jgi:hypothetical protein
MVLPEIGIPVAVQYKRNPTVYSDAALNPRLQLGRVVRHEGSWGFVALLGNYDSVPQETWLEWNDDLEAFEDREFQQPIEWIKFGLDGELLALLEEFESLPEELPLPDGETRAFDEMRLRFLAGGVEAGWLVNPQKAEVFYSDDFPDTGSTVARWLRQELGAHEFTEDRLFFEWPVDERDPSECGVELLLQDDGTYYSKSEQFGDEFQAKLEHRHGYSAVMGLWAGEGFLSFFGAIFPKN